MNFKENLHFLMECKGMQIKELSAKTQISENTIKTYLKEKSAEPNISKALKIARALDVSVEFLATGIDTKFSALTAELLEIHILLKEFSNTDLKLVLSILKTLRQFKKN